MRLRFPGHSNSSRSTLDYSDSIVLTDPSPTSVMDYIRLNLEGLVTGKKSRVVVMVQDQKLFAAESAVHIRFLITDMGFTLNCSTSYYAILERSFPLPL